MGKFGKSLLFGVLLLSLTLMTQSVRAEVSVKDFTIEKFVQELKDQNIQHIDAVVAQAQVESGFTSVLFVKYNNLFGLKLPEQRETFAVGQLKGYAVFSDWRSSVKDYALLQNKFLRNKPGLSTDQYISKMSRIYASNPKYERHWRKALSDVRDRYGSYLTT